MPGPRRGQLDVGTAPGFLEARLNCIVSDIGMPGEDGYELIKKVRALRKKNGGRIPAIALTGFAGLDDKSKAMAAGLSSAYSKTCRLGQSNF
ncbi:MAG TPA: response regulator [Pyrinomonadaceae bacterium]|nr:response regulator [Pyrinomonadaceae bacterium]